MWPEAGEGSADDDLRSEGSVEDGFECSVLSVAELLGFDYFFVEAFCCSACTFEVGVIERVGVDSDCSAEFSEIANGFEGGATVIECSIAEERSLFACHGRYRSPGFSLDEG